MSAAGPVVAVRGEIVREVDPEIAECSVSAMASGRDRQETLRLLTARVESLRELLDGYRDAIESRETTGLYVYPQRKPRTDKPHLYRGYVTTTLTVTDFAVLGELMLRLSDRDETSVNGPWWELRPDSPVHREARTAAIGDAIERARDYAAALGSRVVRLIELADTGLGGRQEPNVWGTPVPAAAGATGGGPQLDLEPARQKVRASVEARFLISEPTVLADTPR